MSNESQNKLGPINQSGPLLLLSTEMLGWAAKVDHLSGQNSDIKGALGGSPKFIFLLESFYFCYIGTHAKI
jgi:hypothetical protein